jgi:hypothetical protein
VAKTAQRLKGRVLRKKFVLLIESWFIIIFSLFSFFFFSHGFACCHVQCDHYNLNVKFFILFKKFNKVHSVEVLNQDPC